MEQEKWLELLASAEPAPGGGGASAVVGTIAAALGSMVANLTRGKKKYAAYESEILQTLEQTEALRVQLYALMQADAEAFVPLSRAYGIPKEDPTRETVLEQALYIAARPPMELLETLAKLPPLLEVLAEKGSRLAVSDVGCAATFCSAAAEGAWINLLVNTRLYRDRARAESENQTACSLKQEIQSRTSAILQQVCDGLQ